MPKYVVTRRRQAPVQIIDMVLEIDGADTPEAQALALEAANDYIGDPDSQDHPDVTLHDMSEPYFADEGPGDDWTVSVTS